MPSDLVGSGTYHLIHHVLQPRGLEQDSNDFPCTRISPFGVFGALKNLGTCCRGRGGVERKGGVQFLFVVILPVFPFFVCVCVCVFVPSSELEIRWEKQWRRVTF